MNTTATNSLPTVRSAFARDSAYWGERGDWLIAYSTNRDADCLARSNWRCFIKLLGGKGSEGAKGTQDISEHVAIEEANHWACGWVQYLIIHPDAAELIAKAIEARDGLEDYPVLDESDFSDLEYEEYHEAFVRDASGEFRRQLKDCEVSERAINLICDAPVETMQTWFEAQIPSGEYQHDGYPCFHLAFDRVTRDQLAALINACRVA